MYTNLNKYQVKNWPALREWNLISSFNGGVKSVSAGQVETFFSQTGIM